jgi:group II intron reverse transcriptase/maturase
MIVAQEMEHLHKLAERDPDKRFTHLWGRMISEKWLTQAWEEIRRNQGSQTPGVDGRTAAHVTPDCIRHLSQELRSHTYRPTPARRAYIPKGKGKRRPLGILTIEDRLVQQALRMVLEPIFEADFLPCSHGFRQGHSTHTALRDVVRMFPRVTWTIEGDIASCFDKIPHNGLMRAVQRRIADQEVLALIKRFLKAGYMEDWQYHQTYSGTPQGGIASPLLCNIFLHQLDDYVVNTLGANQVQTKQESNRRRNPEYRRIDSTIQRYRKKLRRHPSWSERRVYIQNMEAARKELRRTPVYDKRHSSKLGYVRYADDWAILVNGTKQEAEHIKAQIGSFLTDIGLELSDEKTKLTHWSETVVFLGYNIRGVIRDKGNQIRAVLSIPPDRERLIRREIIRVARFHHIPELDAMLRINAMFRGWCNYYRYATSPQEVFNRVARKVWWYFAHFLARKERSSIQKMLFRARKSGRYKMVKQKDRLRQTFVIKSGKKEYSLDIFSPRTQTIHQVKSVNWKVDLKPVNIPGWQFGRSLQTHLTALNRSDGLCERCQTNPAVHAHHKIRMRAKKTLSARVQSDKDQEQTAKALCKECHLESHHGRWTG